MEAIQEYADITELDAATLNRLIKEIVVHESIDSDKMLSVKLNAAACVRLFAAMSVLSGKGPAHSLQPFCQVI